jgi:hypothetical protein
MSLSPRESLSQGNVSASSLLEAGEVSTIEGREALTFLQRIHRPVGLEISTPFGLALLQSNADSNANGDTHTDASTEVVHCCANPRADGDAKSDAHSDPISAAFILWLL